MEHRRTAQCSDGADRERIFTDTASGKLARRPQPLDPVLDHERSVPFTDVEQAHKLALTPAAAEKVVGRGGEEQALAPQGPSLARRPAQLDGGDEV